MQNASTGLKEGDKKIDKIEESIDSVMLGLNVYDR